MLSQANLLVGSILTVWHVMLLLIMIMRHMAQTYDCIITADRLMDDFMLVVYMYRQHGFMTSAVC